MGIIPLHSVSFDWKAKHSIKHVAAYLWHLQLENSLRQEGDDDDDNVRSIGLLF
jgi:hypothetical protein